jgi:hypothetical protein
MLHTILHFSCCPSSISSVLLSVLLFHSLFGKKNGSVTRKITDFLLRTAPRRWLWRLGSTCSEPKWLSRYSDGLRAGQPGLDSRQRQEIFLYTTASRLALGLAWSPIQWVLGTLSGWMKRLGRETDHSPPTRLHGMVFDYLSAGTTLSCLLFHAEHGGN